MKLVRYGKAGRKSPGLIDAAGKIRDLSGVVQDIGPAALAPAMLRKISEAGSGEHCRRCVARRGWAPAWRGR